MGIPPIVQIYSTRSLSLRFSSVGHPSSQPPATHSRPEYPIILSADPFQTMGTLYATSRRTTGQEGCDLAERGVRRVDSGETDSVINFFSTENVIIISFSLSLCVCGVPPAKESLMHSPAIIRGAVSSRSWVAFVVCSYPG